MRKKLNPKLLAAVAGATFLLGGGVVAWQYLAMTGAKTQFAALQADTPTEKELMEVLAETQSRLAEYDQTLAHLESGVPDVAYVPTLMRELEEIGVSSGIKVIGVRPVPESIFGNDDVKKDSPYNEIEIDVTGRGDYFAVMSFIEDLRNFPKVLAVKRLNIVPKREMGDSSKPELEATVTISAFVFPYQASEVEGDVVDPKEIVEVASNKAKKAGGTS